MVNIITHAVKPIMQWVLKLAAGMTPQTVQIEPGSVMNFWAPQPTDTKSKEKKRRRRPVLVFVHGFCGDGITTWFPQVLALSREYSIYVPDLLFFGGSITDSPERTTSFQAECLAKGLKQLGVERCTFVGLSYGGMVGFKLAKMHPELIESMVMCGTVVELTQSISQKSLQRIGFSSWPDYLLPETVEGVKKLLEIACHGQLPWWLPDYFFKHFLQAMYSNRKERAELLDALVIRDEDAMPPNIPQRICLLWGDDDKIFNLEDAYQVKEVLGDTATLEYIERAGHILEVERPFIYNDRLKKILDSLPQAKDDDDDQ